MPVSLPAAFQINRIFPTNTTLRFVILRFKINKSTKEQKRKPRFIPGGIYQVHAGCMAIASCNWQLHGNCKDFFPPNFLSSDYQT